MQKKISLRIAPSVAASNSLVKEHVCNAAGCSLQSLSGYTILKKSIDARNRNIQINLSINAFIDEPFQERKHVTPAFKDVSRAAKKTVIAGAGPAGLFAALQLIEKGIKPILLERGKDVKARRRDLALLNREGIINPESNYCFGEGGAGTYSDGKLYTRSNKRGDIDRILNLFVYFGAEEKILFEAHPHIGTNKLPQIITAMRKCILACGGEYYFEKKVTGLIIKNQCIEAVKTEDGSVFPADDFILSTGHSARDIFKLLHTYKLQLEAKPFALGARVEHPQELIDSIQYHCSSRGEYLPPAAYSLVQQVNKKGVFSFCMCPGGIIAPAATAPAELVVNGWSPSKRNNPFANSGMVVQVELSDILQNKHLGIHDSPLAMMEFQQLVEQKCFSAGGGNFVAPAQRMTDFSRKKYSTTLPGCSYQPGVVSTDLNLVLPEFISEVLAKGFIAFGKKMKGFFSDEAIVVATESRTSSPVRIPRNPDTLTHPQLRNLYPCGEGAGYAGGIVSAAMDGEKTALEIAAKHGK